MNKRGLVESGVAIFTAVLIGVVASTGKLFATTAIRNQASSGFIAVTALLIEYSQMPHVKEGFRTRKAIEACEQSGVTGCSNLIAGLSSEAKLVWIRDDQLAIPTQNQGNFVGGYMNGVSAE